MNMNGNMKATVLVVDDEKTQREMLGRHLRKRGFTVHLAESGVRALEIIADTAVEIMITDQKMPVMSGLELAGTVSRKHPNIPVVIITAFGSIQDAVNAMKNSVEDYLTKPVNLDELDVIIARILEHRMLIRENDRLREQIVASKPISGLVYVSEEMKEVMSMVVRAAESRATVLITGESGTGKELVARAVHQVGATSDGPFVAVNCSAIPENLIESELFGHEKGAFTGAEKKRIGRFEQAEGGTLFLDEIGEIPLLTQVKLLRVLQERAFERVGGHDPITVNVRIAAATNRDLEKEVARGAFREDLYYRINVVRIAMPPLRERKSDITVLAEHFIKRYTIEHGKNVRGVSPDALDVLIKYSFPGNVRELGNIIEQAVVLCRGDIITASDLPLHLSGDSGQTPVSDSMGLEDRLAEMERVTLWKALREMDGNKSAAARLLGISEHKVRYLLKKHGEET